ncbi:hypothetical protein NEOKW01_2012 [Nematocida sp. AWRm80]|nr:hypothetical protein NEOKW01_2012 [Nematocida sp. AWRm80]
MQINRIVQKTQMMTVIAASIIFMVFSALLYMVVMGLLGIKSPKKTNSQIYTHPLSNNSTTKQQSNRRSSITILGMNSPLTNNSNKDSTNENNTLRSPPEIFECYYESDEDLNQIDPVTNTEEELNQQALNKPEPIQQNIQTALENDVNENKEEEQPEKEKEKETNELSAIDNSLNQNQIVNGLMIIDSDNNSYHTLTEKQITKSQNVSLVIDSKNAHSQNACISYIFPGCIVIEQDNQQEILTNSPLAQKVLFNIDMHILNAQLQNGSITMSTHTINSEETDVMHKIVDMQEDTLEALKDIFNASNNSSGSQSNNRIFMTIRPAQNNFKHITLPVNIDGTQQTIHNIIAHLEEKNNTVSLIHMYTAPIPADILTIHQSKSNPEEYTFTNESLDEIRNILFKNESPNKNAIKRKEIIKYTHKTTKVIIPGHIDSKNQKHSLNKNIIISPVLLYQTFFNIMDHSEQSNNETHIITQAKVIEVLSNIVDVINTTNKIAQWEFFMYQQVYRICKIIKASNSLLDRYNDICEHIKLNPSTSKSKQIKKRTKEFDNERNKLCAYINDTEYCNNRLQPLIKMIYELDFSFIQSQPSLSGTSTSKEFQRILYDIIKRMAHDIYDNNQTYDSNIYLCIDSINRLNQSNPLKKKTSATATDSKNRHRTSSYSGSTTSLNTDIQENTEIDRSTPEKKYFNFINVSPIAEEKESPLYQQEAGIILEEYCKRVHSSLLSMDLYRQHPGKDLYSIPQLKSTQSIPKESDPLQTFTKYRKYCSQQDQVNYISELNYNDIFTARIVFVECIKATRCFLTLSNTPKIATMAKKTFNSIFILNTHKRFSLIAAHLNALSDKLEMHYNQTKSKEAAMLQLYFKNVQQNIYNTLMIQDLLINDVKRVVKQTRLDIVVYEDIKRSIFKDINERNKYDAEKSSNSQELKYNLLTNIYITSNIPTKSEKNTKYTTTENILYIPEKDKQTRASPINNRTHKTANARISASLDNIFNTQFNCIKQALKTDTSSILFTKLIIYATYSQLRQIKEQHEYEQKHPKETEYNFNIAEYQPKIQKSITSTKSMVTPASHHKA